MNPKTLRTILIRIQEIEQSLLEQQRREAWLLGGILASVFLNILAVYRMLQ